MNPFRRTWNYFAPERGRMAMVVALLVVSIGASLLKPWPLAVIVDSVLGDAPGPGWLGSAGDKSLLLVQLCVLILIIHTAHGALSALQNYVSIQIGLRGLTRVRNALFEQLQRLSMRFHQGSRAGDLIYRATWDTYAFQTVFQQGLVTFATAALTLLLMLGVMWRLSVLLTLVAIGLVPLLLLAIRHFGAHMRSRGMEAQQADSRVSSSVEQGIASMPLIHSYGLEAEQSRRFRQHTEVAERSRLQQHAWELLYWLAIAIVFGLGMTAIVWLGAQQVEAGELTLGQLLVFVAYVGQLYEPLNQLSHVGATVATAGAGIQRVYEILDSGEIIHEAFDARPLSEAEARGQIAFEGISFAYAAERPVLREISFQVNAGESVAIIGPSGSGKTTLLNLLLRFFDPTGGTIRLGDTPASEFHLADLRRNISYLLQEPLLMPGTLAENIALGYPGATTEQIREAARLANCDELIQSLPQGYETLVGDGAVRMSVGEKQRINLARALLKNAPILLLDEPTSALDAISESAVLEGLKNLMRDRTTLIVAHRLNTIQAVDKILVLEDGRVTEFGTPGELLASGGYYARMLRSDGQPPPAA